MTTALILAIEPDSSRAFQLKSIARQVGAELRLADSVAGALAALDEQVPDLILIPALLSAKDDLALSERLRGLGTAAAHIQTLTIPILETAADMTLFGSGVFGTPRRQKQSMGCAADTFAEQVRIYLDRAAEARQQAPSPIRSVLPVDTTASREPPAMSERSASDSRPVGAPESATSVDESFVGIDESLSFDEEPPAATETPSAHHPPALEEFDLEAFMSEEFLHDDSVPSASVPAPVAPAFEAPTILIRRAISTSVPSTHEEMHDFLPEEPPAAVPSDASILSEELFEFAPEEPARSETRGTGKHDGWHALDPTQSRFVALLARLDEIAVRPA